jgi:hypothetical protein
VICGVILEAAPRPSGTQGHRSPPELVEGR